MKKVAACLATVCVFCLAAAWFYFPRQLPRPDAFVPRQLPRPDAFALIKAGMTQAEVEALVGGPPGNYGVCTTGFSSGLASLEAARGPGACIEKCWWDDFHHFAVWFDSNNRVAGLDQTNYQGIR
jgi:hypothetical protein